MASAEEGYYRAYEDSENGEQNEEDLVATAPTENNWKGMLIALAVIIVVCSLILLSIHLLRPPQSGPRVKGRKITLSDILSTRFATRPFNGTWISENELLFLDYLGGLSILNAETHESRSFLPNTTFRQLNSQIYSVSPDRKFILFGHDDHAVWEHNYLAKYTIFDIENEFTIPLSSSEKKEEDQSELQYATWASKGNTLIFVYQNDIYLKMEPKAQRIVRLTDTGKPGVIFNGVPDFIYEEEILKSESALWPSPNGKRLLYATFNDSAVGESVFSWYADGDAYPRIKTLRYPKTGTTNPQVKLWVAEIARVRPRSIKVNIPDQIIINEHYFTAADWFDDDTIITTWLNRKHTIGLVLRCKGPIWNCAEVHSVKHQGPGWLEFLDLPFISTDASSFLMRLPWRDGEAGHFQHVLWVDGKSQKEFPVTHGPHEVTKIIAWDEPNHHIYFIGVPNGYPGQRHLYRISEKGPTSTYTPMPVCLTCPLVPSTKEIKEDREDPDESLGKSVYTMTDANSTSSPINATGNLNSTVPSVRTHACLYNNVIFSPNKKFFVRECLGPGVPMVTLHSAPSGRLLMVLNNNTKMRDEVDNLGLPMVRNFLVPLEGGYRAPVRLLIPQGVREEEEFKFPLVVHVNGNPGSQQISEKWGLSWATYLTSQKNFIVAEIDARGTGCQGESHRHTIYRKLGNYEVKDHLKIIQYLVDHLNFIDSDNMMIWGKNYGAYLAALILAQDSMKFFRCGIFVSPITRWEFYNTVFTERYMGMPNYTDNYKGYEQADLTREEIVGKLKGKEFLIIHGTADNTVHFQHTLQFSKQLVNNGVNFMEQIYPDEDNDLRGVSEHLYGTMEDFIDAAFDEFNFDEWEKANFLGRKV